MDVLIASSFKIVEMNWNRLESIEELNQAIDSSEACPVLLFKHSTRCGTSSMALKQLERNWTFDDGELQPYFLDLLKFRPISNEIANRLRVPHESPQAIVISDRKVIYSASHYSIDLEQWKKTMR